MPSSDQNSIKNNESQEERYNRGLDIFIESLLKPDTKLRSCAHNQNCYSQLMDIRDTIVLYAKTLRK